MTKKTLTAAGIRSLRATDQRREIRDGGSAALYLIVQTSGHKSFAMRFRRPDGRPAKLVLGPFDPTQEGDSDPVIGAPLTLAAARHLAADILRERARGKDVVAARKAAKVKASVHHREASANTFTVAARDFVEHHARPKTRGWQVTASLLGFTPEGEVKSRGLADRWSDRSVASIDGHDVYAVVEEARQHRVPGLGVKGEGPSEARARHLYAALSVLFSWLLRHRRVESNPCSSVHRPDAARVRDRVLTDAEVVEFWQASDGLSPPFRAILRLLLLTGCRLNEVAGMRSSELSDDGATWTIPAARTKNHRVHVVPLPPMAREIVAQVTRWDNCPLVFTTNGTTPVSGWSKVKRRLDKAMGDVPPWRLHDLRRTAATGMATIGVAPHIVEAALNHISGARAGVAGIYNRAAYTQEKKAALERWAGHVASLVSDAKVMPLRGGERT